ncbi:MAG: hypothetical protein H6718_11590 [Polyangiaceae bacterium]|nr:hypothetical protein [Myxococcales bacterium]MCB9586033.1 hypothetical protein [Polyangiaceae bacterium]MCB9608951.1 hypothetical protein [Polyangiaceae bacterium]
MSNAATSIVSLNISGLGLVTASGSNLLESLFFSDASVEPGVPTPFFKPAEIEGDDPEPIQINRCPWLEAELPLSERCLRMAERAAREALEPLLANQTGDEPVCPELWLILPCPRDDFSELTAASISQELWKRLSPSNVRTLFGEAATMDALKEIHTTMKGGAAAALLLAVDSFFSVESAEREVTQPVTPWEPLPPLKAEAAAAVLFTAKSPSAAADSLSRSRLGSSRLGTKAPESNLRQSYFTSQGLASGGTLSEPPTSMRSSRLSGTALGALSSSHIARLVATGSAKAPANEHNDVLQDGLVMTYLLETLSAAIRPDWLIGPTRSSLFRSREWEMALCRCRAKVADEFDSLDVETVFGRVGAAAVVVSIVYSVAATRLGLKEPKDGNLLTSCVWNVSPDGNRGLLALMTQIQTETQHTSGATRAR